MSDPKIVVTATGLISALGAGAEEFGRKLFAGENAARPSTRFGGMTTAEIEDFDAQPWLGNKGIRVLNRCTRLLAVAAHMALKDSDLCQTAQETLDPEIGLVCGTLFGSVHSITSFDWSGITDGPGLVSPMEFPNTVINAPAGQVAIRYRFGGVNSTVCAGLASGLHAIQYAAEFLRFGRARVLLAGGADELCEESVNGFRQIGAAGIVPGEGAALWVLETADAARAAGRLPLFEICGFGCAQDAYGISQFDLHGCGATQAMRQALADAHIAPEQVACVIASSSGTRAGDEMEARALETVFGDRLRHTPVCAPKAAFGEAMGASGALSAMVAGMALQRQTAPPTANFTTQAAALPLSSQPAAISGEYALVNAFSCDGNNATLAIRLWKT